MVGHLKKPASGDPDRDVIVERLISSQHNFLQELMKAGRILWAPRLGVRRIVTVYRIFGEDFVTPPRSALFSGGHRFVLLDQPGNGRAVPVLRTPE
jgi:hypothetical protein